MPDTAQLADSLSEKRKHFLAGLYTTALEGGIDYWATVVSYHWRKDHSPISSSYEMDIDGFHAEIKPLSDEDGWGVFQHHDTRALTVDLAVIDRGASLFRQLCEGVINSIGKVVPEGERKPIPPAHYWHQWMAADATDGEDGDYDADVADIIVQLGLFGREAY